MRPELAEELAFMHVQGAARKVQQRAAAEAKKSDPFHHRETASRLPAGRLRKSALILRRVGHGKIGAIDDFYFPSQPAAFRGDIGFHAPGQVIMNAVESLLRKSRPSLAVSAG